MQQKLSDHTIEELTQALLNKATEQNKHIIIGITESASAPESDIIRVKCDASSLVYLIDKLEIKYMTQGTKWNNATRA